MNRASIRWGPLMLDDIEITTVRGRGLLAQIPARGAGGHVQDRGPGLKECRVSVQWTARGNDDDPVARHKELLALDDGKTRLLMHPVDGAYPAKMSIEDERLQRGQIDATLRFVEDRGDPRYMRRPAPGVSPRAAIEAARRSAREASVRMESAGLPVTAARDSEALARDWADQAERGEKFTAADVNTGLSRQLATIHNSLNHTDIENNPENIDIWYGLLSLSAAMSDAAAAITASSPGLVVIEIAETTTLLALSASLYGGQAAQQRAAEIARLNDLRTPNAIPAHTSLMVPHG